MTDDFLRVASEHAESRMDSVRIEKSWSYRTEKLKTCGWEGTNIRRADQETPWA